MLISKNTENVNAETGQMHIECVYFFVQYNITHLRHKSAWFWQRHFGFLEWLEDPCQALISQPQSLEDGFFWWHWRSYRRARVGAHTVVDERAKSLQY